MANEVEITITAKDLTGPAFASVMARLAALKGAYNDVTGSAVRNDIATTRLVRGWGLLGMVAAASRGKVDLFGGSLSAIPLMGAVGGFHLLADGVAEFLAVVVPATVGLIAFGVAAAPTVRSIYTEMKNLGTVATATNQAIYPLGHTLDTVASSVKPEVYQMFGDAITLITKKAGAFSSMAQGVGHSLDYLSAWFTVAFTHGSAFGGVMQNAAADVKGLGQVTGNLGGAIGNILAVLPGYANDLLNLAVGASKVVEVTTHVAQPVIGMGLAFHGALLYAGLLGTGLGKLVSGGLNLLSAGFMRSSNFAEKFGASGVRAATGLAGLSVAAERAAGLPWGWISVAAIGLGFLAYKLLTAKDATQQWVSTMQNALMTTPAAQANAAFMKAQIGISAQLAAAQQRVTDTAAQLQGALGKSRYVTEGYYFANLHAIGAVKELKAGTDQLSQSQALYRNRMTQLSQALGGANNAQGMVAASGVKLGDMLTKDKYQWMIVKQEILATANAYRAMGQRSGVLGADMAALNATTSDQYTTMNNLNNAWNTYINTLTGGEQTFTQAITYMHQLKTQIHAAGASFTGVNSASIALRTTMSQQYLPTIQKVIDAERQQGVSTKGLAQTLSTLLAPALDHGVMKNQSYRDSIIQLAKAAGYTGPNSIAVLMNWLDKNVTSLGRVSKAVDTLRAQYLNLPKNVYTNAHLNDAASLASLKAYEQYLQSLNGQVLTQYLVTVHDTVQGHAFGGVTSASGGARSNMTLVGEHGPELISVPGGSRVFSNPDSRRMLADGGGGGGGSMVFQLGPGGSVIDEMLFNWLRMKIREKGGQGPISVQKALGYTY